MSSRPETAQVRVPPDASGLGRIRDVASRCRTQARPWSLNRLDRAAKALPASYGRRLVRHRKGGVGTRIRKLTVIFTDLDNFVGLENADD